MRTILAAIVVIALTAGHAPPPAAAEAKIKPFSASSLYEGCMAPQASYYYQLCINYVNGFAEGYATAGNGAVAQGGPMPAACWDETQTIGDIRMAFVLWVQSHPDKIKVSAADAMSAAIVASFLCKAK